MVMANPMLVTMVMAVPFISWLACWATSVLNKGESAITVSAQKIMYAKNRGLGNPKAKGEKRQQIPENNKKHVAILFVPNRSERKPPKAQAIEPRPITAKD